MANNTFKSSNTIATTELGTIDGTKHVLVITKERESLYTISVQCFNENDDIIGQTVIAMKERFGDVMATFRTICDIRRCGFIKGFKTACEINQ